MILTSRTQGRSATRSSRWARTMARPSETNYSTTSTLAVARGFATPEFRTLRAEARWKNALLELFQP